MDSFKLRKQLLALDNEEDLLNYQEEYMKNKSNIDSINDNNADNNNIKIIRPGNYNGNNGSNNMNNSMNNNSNIKGIKEVKEEKKIVSKFKQRMISDKNNDRQHDSNINIINNNKDNTDENIKNFASSIDPKAINNIQVPVLGEIKERDIAETHNIKIDIRPSGFPIALHRSEKLVKTTKVIESNKKNVKFDITSINDTDSDNEDNNVDINKLEKQIDQENNNKIASMTEEEIIAAREELMSALSPAMIEFFNNKRNTTTKKSVIADNENKIRNADSIIEKINLKSNITDNKDIQSKKLIQSTSINNTPSNEISTIVSTMFDPINLRFDLQGRVIKEEDQELLPTHLGLHHNEENKAGYALQDIKILLRSTFPSQCITAIKICSGIVDGLYRGLVTEKVWDELIPDIMTALTSIFSQSHMSVLQEGISLLDSIMNPWFTFPFVDHDLYRGNEELVFSKYFPVIDPFIDAEPMEASNLNSSDSSPIIPVCDMMSMHIPFLISQLGFANSTIYSFNCLKVIRILKRLVLTSPDWSRVIIQEINQTHNKVKSNKLMNVFELIIFSSEMAHLLRIEILDLIRIMCSSSKEAAATLLRSKLLDYLKRFIVDGSVLISNNLVLEDNKIEIIACGVSALKVWKVCLMYGLDFSTSLDLLPTLMNPILNSKFKVNSNPICDSFLRASLSVYESFLILSSDVNIELDRQLSKETVMDSTSLGNLFYPIEGQSNYDYRCLDLFTLKPDSLRPDDENINEKLGTIEEEELFIGWENLDSIVEPIYKLFSSLYLKEISNGLSESSLKNFLSFFAHYVEFAPHELSRKFNTRFSLIFKNISILSSLTTELNSLKMPSTAKDKCNLVNIFPNHELVITYDSFSLSMDIVHFHSFEDSDNFLIRLNFISTSLNAYFKLLIILILSNFSCDDVCLDFDTALSLAYDLLSTIMPSAHYIFSSSQPNSVEAISWKWRYRNSILLFYSILNFLSLVVPSDVLSGSKLWSLAINNSWLFADTGMESYYIDIMRKIIFNPAYLLYALNQLKKINFTEHSLNLLKSCEFLFQHKDNMEQFCDNLSSLFKYHYSNHNDTVSSILLTSQRYKFVSSLFVSHNKNKNFPFINYLIYPLFHLKCIPLHLSVPEKAEIVSNLLQLNMIALFFNENCIKTDLIRGTLEVYLSGSEIYTSRNVHTILNFLSLYLNSFEIKNLSLQTSFWGSADRFLHSYIESFFADSFGDSINSRCILTCLLQKNDTETKFYFWTELIQNIRTFEFNIHPLFHLSNYLAPIEVDMKLLMEYSKSLATGVLEECQFFKFYAIHHLNQYIFKSDSLTTTQLKLLEIILKDSSMATINAFLNYNYIEESNDIVFEENRIHFPISTQLKLKLFFDDHLDIAKRLNL